MIFYLDAKSWDTFKGIGYYWVNEKTVAKYPKFCATIKLIFFIKPIDKLCNWNSLTCNLIFVILVLMGKLVGWLFCFTAYQPFSGHLTPNCHFDKSSNNLGEMTTKRFSASPKAPALLEPHHHIV